MPPTSVLVIGHRPPALGDALEPARNAFEIAFEGRLAAGRK
jgi:hypothetical protein